MKKLEIISISLGIVLFVITNLLLNDVLGKSNIAMMAAIGGASALFAFWWSYKLLPRWTLAKKIFFTLLYLAVAIISAVYLTSLRGSERKLQIIGKWISPANDEGDSELIFEFKSNDSLIVTVDSQKIELAYEIMRGDHILAIDRYGEQKFKWSITTLNAEKLIIGDRGKTMELERTE
jgi:hypothetical protein